jgi:hypothetical protein
MDDSGPQALLPFLPVAAGRAGVRMHALSAARLAGTILVHCRGIEVGCHPIAAAAADFDVPIRRIPRVDLPAELRFSLAEDGREVAPPWPLPNAATALALVGPGELTVEDLRLEQGVLRGYAINRVNGLLDPVMYARINGAGARGVAVEPPGPLPEGGCAFRFALPLEPGDLNETGLSVALHLVGLEAPVARYAYARVGLEGPSPRLAELEERIARLEQAAATNLRALQEEQRRQVALLQERTDAFIEAAASLLLDRIAAERGEAPADAAIAALHRLIREAAAAPPATEPLLLGRRAEVPPAAGNLAIGWHPPEQDEGGAFRWMSEAALVVNPEPFRPVASVTLTVRHLYGAAEPALRGDFDGVPAEVAVSRDEATGGFAVVLTPADGAPAACQGLRLDAPNASSPERDGVSPDPRVLSVAVAGIAFDYASPG